MSLSITVGVLADYEPLDPEEERNIFGLCMDIREQFKIVNRILQAKGLPVHHEPETPKGGAWWVGTTWDAVEGLKQFVCLQMQKTRTTCKFKHLLSLQPDQLIIPVSFQHALKTGRGLFLPMSQNVWLVLKFLRLVGGKLPFQAIPSSYQLRDECDEAARLLGLDSKSFPRMRVDEDDKAVWKEWTHQLNPFGFSEDVEMVARACLKLYHASLESIERGAAIHLG